MEASKSSIKETKGFKNQITLKVMLKNTSQMEKLNLDQFNLIQQQKTVINHESNLEMLFKKFCIGMITGLMKDLAGYLNSLRLSILPYSY